MKPIDEIVNVYRLRAKEHNEIYNKLIQEIQSHAKLIHNTSLVLDGLNKKLEECDDEEEFDTNEKSFDDVMKTFHELENQYKEIAAEAKRHLCLSQNLNEFVLELEINGHTAYK